MYIVTNRIQVAQGHEEAFEERFRNRAGLIDQEPGFIRNVVMRPAPRAAGPGGGEGEATPVPYLVQTWWRSEEDFLNWTRSESFRQAHQNRPPQEMFSGPSRLETHQVVLDTDSVS